MVSNFDTRQELVKLGKSLPEPLYVLIQWLITLLAGKPYVGQQPLFKPTRINPLLMTLVFIFGGAALSAWIWQSLLFCRPFLIVSWAFTVGGARMVQTGINHRCVHKQFFGNHRDRWLVEILSTLLFIQDWETLFEQHIKRHHHADKFASFTDDPDAKFLWRLGFRPDLAEGTKSTSPYWRLFWRTLLSPQFHYLLMRGRVRSNYLRAPLYRRLMAVGCTAMMVATVWTLHQWVLFCVAWLFPLTLLYNIATLTELLSEHDWAGSGSNESKSWGRFCGEAPPEGKSPIAWLRWAGRMLYHSLIRISVLGGEMPEHDWHHNCPKEQEQWANGMYARQRHLEQGGQYQEFWGIENAMEHVFQRFIARNSVKR